MLKLDFKKAYDTINLAFLVWIMSKLGIPSYFIDLVKILFVNANIFVSINGADIEQFPIQRGMCQGCLLSPYLFLFVGQALNDLAKFQLQAGLIHGMRIPNHHGQQLLVQYADDTNFTLLGSEGNLLVATNLLSEFHSAPTLETNWDKSFAY